MATRATWGFETLLEEAETDDWIPVEEVATPIEINQDGVSLRNELRVLLKSENRLFNMGITCPIRDSGEACCSICPLSKYGTEDELAPLCAIGRRQERVLTELAIAAQAA